MGGLEEVEAKAHKETILAKAREKYAANPEKRLASSADRYAANPEKKLATNRAWHIANREAHNAMTAAWSITHREQERKTDAAWRAANPGKIREYNARRRARKLNALCNDLTDGQWEEIKVSYGSRCVYCPLTCWRCQRGTHALTMDHLQPLSKGGNHTVQNIVPACKSCNSKKSNGPPLAPVQPLLLTAVPAKEK